MGWSDAAARAASTRRKRMRAAARERRRHGESLPTLVSSPGLGPALTPQGVAGPLGTGESAVLLASAAAAGGFDFPEEPAANCSRAARPLGGSARSDRELGATSSKQGAPRTPAYGASGDPSEYAGPWHLLCHEDAAWARAFEESVAVASAAAAQALASQNAGRAFERSAGESLGSVMRTATGNGLLRDRGSVGSSQPEIDSRLLAAAAHQRDIQRHLYSAGGEHLRMLALPRLQLRFLKQGEGDLLQGLGDAVREAQDVQATKGQPAGTDPESESSAYPAGSAPACDAPALSRGARALWVGDAVHVACLSPPDNKSYETAQKTRLRQWLAEVRRRGHPHAVVFVP